MDYTPYKSREQALGYMRLHIRNANRLVESQERIKQLDVSPSYKRRATLSLNYERQSARECARIAGLI